MIGRVIVLLVAALFMAGIVQAREITDPRSYAKGEKGMGTSVHVFGTYESRNGCARFVGKHLGDPSGAPEPAGIVTGVIEVTFVVEDSRGNCGGPRFIQDLIVTNSEVTNYMVRIYFVSPGGRVLKIENTSIRG